MELYLYFDLWTSLLTKDYRTIFPLEHLYTAFKLQNQIFVFTSILKFPFYKTFNPWLISLMFLFYSKCLYLQISKCLYLHCFPTSLIFYWYTLIFYLPWILVLQNFWAATSWWFFTVSIVKFLSQIDPHLFFLLLNGPFRIKCCINPWTSEYTFGGSKS